MRFQVVLSYMFFSFNFRTYLQKNGIRHSLSYGGIPPFITGTYVVKKHEKPNFY